MALTHGPDPVHLLAGAGTAAEQAARPRLYADPDGTGWTETPPPDKGAAEPGDTFVELTVTAEDAPNAAKLGPLGYVALPQTAWTVGQAINVSGFRFHWNGSAWTAGAAPVVVVAAPAPPPTQY